MTRLESIKFSYHARLWGNITSDELTFEFSLTFTIGIYSGKIISILTLVCITGERWSVSAPAHPGTAKLPRSAGARLSTTVVDRW